MQDAWLVERLQRLALRQVPVEAVAFHLVLKLVGSPLRRAQLAAVVHDSRGEHVLAAPSLLQMVLQIGALDVKIELFRRDS